MSTLQAPADTDETFAISDVAALTGVATTALRYYEQAGLMLGSVDRASSSHRRYTAGDVRWVTFVTRLRSTGMPIRDIRRYTELAREGEGTTADRLALLREHRERVLLRLAETTSALEAIDFKIDSYERITTR